jgi:hypothetical protein
MTERELMLAVVGAARPSVWNNVALADAISALDAHLPEPEGEMVEGGG